MDWNEYYNQYYEALNQARKKLTQKELIWERYFIVDFTSEYVINLLESQPRIASEVSSASDEEIQWFIESLKDEERKWFSVYTIGSAESFPEILFPTLIRAAIYEIDPSLNKLFIWCAQRFGHHRVNEALLKVIEHGTNFEKAGAVNALYWADNEDDDEYLVPEEYATHDELTEVRLRKRCLFLQEFVRNPDVNVRRSLVAHIEFDPSCYPDELKPLIGRAIQIAKGHPDQYIHHRVGVQLGTEGALMPIPHRNPESKT